VPVFAALTFLYFFGICGDSFGVENAAAAR
jgi:hypothetical protein